MTVGKRLERPNPLGFVPNIVAIVPNDEGAPIATPDAAVRPADAASIVAPSDAPVSSSIAAPVVLHGITVKLEKEDTPVISRVQEASLEEQNKNQKPSPTKRTASRRIRMDDD